MSEDVTMAEDTAGLPQAPSASQKGKERANGDAQAQSTPTPAGAKKARPMTREQSSRAVDASQGATTSSTYYDDSAHTASLARRAASSSRALSKPTTLKQDYVKGSGKTMKFKPNLSAAAHLPSIKQEPDSNPPAPSELLANPDGVPLRRRDRGPISRTATGPLSQGPALAPKTKKRVAEDMRASSFRPSIADLDLVGDAGSKANAKKAEAEFVKTEYDSDPDTAGVDGDPDGDDMADFIENDLDQEDEERYKLVRHTRMIALKDIGKEGSMAPLTLPEDDSVAREAYARHEDEIEMEMRQEEQQSEEQRQYLQAQQAQMSRHLPQSHHSQVKPEEDHDRDSQILSSGIATPTNAARASRNFTGEEPLDSNVDQIGELDTTVSIKQEAIKAKFDSLDFGEPGTDHDFFVMQFPRFFPAFRPPDSEPTIDRLDHDQAETKQTIETKQNIRAPPYKAGHWQGWGKSGGMLGRQILENLPEGKIGTFNFHASGRISMNIGEIRYDVTSGADAGFLQEIAAVDAEPDVGDHRIRGTLRGDGQPGLYVLAQTSTKLIARPNIDDIFRASKQARADDIARKHLLSLKDEFKNEPVMTPQPVPAKLSKPSMKR
ncbi:hypothetical protein E5Q_06762 [Mixia osmundae IAM 14324]|uniref:Uncharacterized protein n=2 Tax=Mixia osmundae (strain CBS 9802 / IAM 14324 / JCM 22182 / KY 12970) TaxID=764103 RepID=G7EB49_MIXOS|nr:hypothetical protein E5Q_06762 [Mixia osmundae IAM 14324]